MKLVRQSVEAECGLACLSMINKYYGVSKRLSEYRTQFNIGRDGISLFQLTTLLKKEQLDPHVIKLHSFKGYEWTKTPKIILSKNSHFVVIQKKMNKFNIYDPDTGEYRISLNELDEKFENYIIDFERKRKIKLGFKFENEFRYIFKELKNVKAVFSLFLILSVVLHLVSLYLPIILKKIIDQFSIEQFSFSSNISKSIIILFIIYIGISITRNFVITKMQSDLYKNLSLRTISHTLKIPFSYFDNRSEGNILFRLGLLGQVQSLISNSFIQIIISSISIFVISIYMLINYFKYFIFALWFMILIGVFMGVTNKILYKKQAKQMVFSEKVNNIQTEIVSNIFQIKSMKLNNYFFKWYEKSFGNLLDHYRKNMIFSNNIALCIMAASIFFPVIVVFAPTLIVYNYPSVISPGTIFLIYTLTSNLLNQTVNLSTQISGLVITKSSLFYLNDLLDEPEEKMDKIYCDKKDSHLLLELKEVYFKYNDTVNNTLNNINLKVYEGEKVSLVGRSGSGKTTLIKIITQLYKPNEGTILFNSNKNREVRVSVIPQNVIIFNKSIRDNITMDDYSLTDEMVNEALKISDLYDTVNSMPLGLNTILSDKGNNLSGGQIQRLAISRAVITNPDLLVLDESTSSLDSLTENKIYANLKKQSISCLVISHRLATITDSERIYFLENGEIKGKGSHLKLLEVSPSYKEMYLSQTS